MCVLGSCSLQDEEVTQTVSGRLVQEGSAVLGTIKVLSTSGLDCSAEGIASSVDGDGKFHLTRKVERGALAVVVQDDLICYGQSGNWEVVWQSGPYGPAAETLTVNCTKSEAAWKCSVVTNWGTDLAVAAAN
jgi:hypothetical protein